MKTIRFTLNRNIINNLKQINKNGLTLDNAFTVKTDILNSSFLYELETHDSLIKTKNNLTQFLNKLEVNNINWNILPQTLSQHIIVINKPSPLIEQKTI
jgi:hypothetical protein